MPYLGTTFALPGISYEHQSTNWKVLLAANGQTYGRTYGRTTPGSATESPVEAHSTHHQLLRDDHLGDDGVDGSDVELEGRRQRLERHRVVNARESEQISAQRLLLNLVGYHREDLRALDGKVE